MGIPTVVDCRTLLHDLACLPRCSPPEHGGHPRDVDLLIDRGAHLSACGKPRLQPELTPEEVAYLIA